MSPSRKQDDGCISFMPTYRESKQRNRLVSSKEQSNPWNLIIVRKSECIFLEIILHNTWYFRCRFPPLHPPPPKFLGNSSLKIWKKLATGKKKNSDNYTQSCDLQINLRGKKKKKILSDLIAWQEKRETGENVVGIPRHSHCTAARFLAESI